MVSRFSPSVNHAVGAVMARLCEGMDLGSHSAHVQRQSQLRPEREQRRSSGLDGLTGIFGRSRPALRSTAPRATCRDSPTSGQQRWTGRCSPAVSGK